MSTETTRTDDASTDNDQDTFGDDYTAFQRDLLFAINDLESGDGQPSGADIKTYLEADYDTEVHHGRLYPNLDTLIYNGLLEKSDADGRTNHYSVTRTGHRLLVNYTEHRTDQIGATL